MDSFDVFILTAGWIYLLALAAFLGFLAKIPRVWRLLAYAGLCAAHLFAAWVLHSLRAPARNCASGLRAQEFFASLQTQLAAGNFTAEYLELPGCRIGIALSLLALAAIVCGAACAFAVIRWYSYLILPVTFLAAALLFAYPDAVDDRHDINGHNALRREVHAVVAEKRAQGVTARQMADAVAATLPDFRYSYENRTDEKRSCERILAALRALPPSPKTPVSGR